MEFLKSLENPMVVMGIMALAGLKIFEVWKAQQRRTEDMNGGNPVVRAIGKLEETTRDEHRKTRETLTDRIDRHDQRCEQRWDHQRGGQQP